jgi:cytochrome c peroxidase
MCTIELAQNRYRRPEGLTLAQRRGKAVFERKTSNDGTPLSPEQRCVTCHSGAHKTNRRRADVATTMWFDAAIAMEPGDIFNTSEFGELGSFFFIDAGLPTKSFDVPHLRNIYESAPYLHNGVADTLEEIWTRFNMVNRHGATGDLTRRQFNDLIAYLKSL